MSFAASISAATHSSGERKAAFLKPGQPLQVIPSPPPPACAASDSVALTTLHPAPRALAAPPHHAAASGVVNRVLPVPGPALGPSAEIRAEPMCRITRAQSRPYPTGQRQRWRKKSRTAACGNSSEQNTREPASTEQISSHVTQPMWRESVGSPRLALRDAADRGPAPPVQPSGPVLAQLVAVEARLRSRLGSAPG